MRLEVEQAVNCNTYQTPLLPGLHGGREGTMYHQCLSPLNMQVPLVSHLVSPAQRGVACC